MIFPTREIIVAHNFQVIQATGGEFFPPENLINPDSLEWVLDVIQYPLFDHLRYPSFSERMAILAWTIIDDHVFFDGNKRTAMYSMITFAKMNGVEVEVTNEEIIEKAVAIAKQNESKFTFDEFSSWVAGKTNFRYFNGYL